MSIDADISASEDLFGKTVNDLQTNVTVGTDAITGTLQYVTDYTGFSSKVEEQSGNYLAIHCAVPEADDAEITVELVGGTSGPRKLDADGLIVLLIRNTNQSVKVVTTKAGFDSVTKTFALTGLTLNPAE